MRPAAAILAGGIRRFEPEPPVPPPPPPEGACPSCGDRGHLVDNFVNGRWVQVRGCNVCGMTGDP